ncbi:adenylate/guanylate cyclase domain-containing protein [Cupriavidus taiwanensis]|uniref:adenylate/guanylate cyclase domain-containing protein n=1 Tax=Cupriavidus taiwanensis TaxID=164546 RepID=UPI000E10AA9B|nr:adenylate/guanylate cyclase domain-containing protein [Cupriavidus taiwanensis]SOY70677.1 Adenylate cyclase Cya [Cupriavidus taiwanensis]SOY72234.1 Adenylate cyclase Cya [Cupriavidus taiwanensis]SOY95799.1 Adenylate cyclase Cya [Cupriavidus taiwanensis]SOZ75014.1 Adenylate cyclase Cya [Cupriavidus taiwanensis]SOZ88547.1 Adenylate cyclase Cya [Cupriavidus taiwanensis]
MALISRELFAASPELRVRDVTLYAHDDFQTQRAKLASIMLDAMFQYVGLLDLDGRMLEINRAALDGIGIHMDDIRGKPFWEARWWVISPETQNDLRQLIQRAGQGEFVRSDFEVYSQNIGAETIIVDFSLVPIRDSNGNVVFLLPEGRNITEKKRAEAALAQKNKELQASWDLICRQRDELQNLYDRLMVEQKLSERLLLNLLPYPIAERLKARPEIVADSIPEIIADSFPEVTVLFADIVAFTRFSTGMSAEHLVAVLNEIFTEFDTIADRRGLEKIKTIGDAYMAAAGLPEPIADHAVRAADMALDMIDALNLFNRRTGYSLQMRIGINSGSVVAGVIGKRKFIYDLWGDAVNTASRMESHSLAGRVQVTDATRNLLEKSFLFEERGIIAAKGIGTVHTWFLTGRREPISR